MGEHLVPVLLITANVGSVFENVSKYLCSFFEVCLMPHFCSCDKSVVVQ